MKEKIVTTTVIILIYGVLWMWGHPDTVVRFILVLLGVVVYLGIKVIWK